MAIRIVLVRPTHAGNIGAAARAMKNMGFTDLALVTPHAEVDAEARALSVHAVDVLERARRCDSLETAISNCVLVLGTSARSRRIDWPTVTPRECAERVAISASQGDVAVVFGPERTGLSNEEMDRCHHLVTIPTDPSYSSLNVAAAVQILTYEMRLAQLAVSSIDEPGALEAPADQAQMERFYAHLEEALVAIAFLDPANPKMLMRRLRRLFNRARPDQNEMNILRGILTETMKKVRELDNRDGRSA